ncbi:Predicted PurR-regulated permease PerM [Ekhidna lutea]|uniref:Predicted PurR-regulated permease PerM n=1 Tax=Ekhidna lutea TaxID=447679 RepID=A0A239HL82_EKHLU|nr:AI-2E family transporter [Ekhidna lutea]SNS81915.1 Predicted PurR-regulated permease PerM [Ekhidna lutea]
MNDRKTTNILLLILVVPLVFYLLKTLSFIFIPLVSSMFIALLFLPLMRWFKKKRVPKILSITIVILIIATFFKLSGELIQLSSREILATDNAFFEKAKIKLTTLLNSVEVFFGVDFLQGEDTLGSLIQKDTIIKNFAPTVSFITDTVSMTLVTIFFVVLFLAGSIDMQKVLNSTILKQHFSSVKTFMKIEKELITFIKVKFFLSLFTGIGIGIACWGFGVSFPIFWGLFAFMINFLQMIGSVITVVLLAVFAFVEIEAASMLFLFVLTTTGVQTLFGGVLEPIFMGKSFSINVITILIMLMLWGYVWGIPGLIMSIPITVFLKILFDQSESTKVISELISGKSRSLA